MVETLVRAKSWLQHRNRHGQTLLQAAAAAGQRDVILTLLHKYQVCYTLCRYIACLSVVVDCW